MAVISNDTPRLSNLVKYEIFPEFAHCRTAVVANEATARTYRVGEVLGRVTVGGKYRVSLSGAADGSQTIDAICLEDKVIPANTDVTVLTMTRGVAGIARGALFFDASYTTPQRDTAVATLESRGISVLTQA